MVIVNRTFSITFRARSAKPKKHVPKQRGAGGWTAIDSGRYGAREVVTERFADLEKRILKRLAEDPNADAGAFRDPDFQYLITRAQHAHARSGGEPTAEILIELIAERAKQCDRNRLALTLNQAVEKAGTLTTNEFAALSLIFLFRHTSRHDLTSLPLFVAYLNELIEPFISDVSMEESSYAYLEAQGCGTRSMGLIEFQALLVANYSGFLSKGFAREELAAVLTAGQLQDPYILLPCLHDSSRVQANADNKETFENAMRAHGLSQNSITAIWAKHENSLMSRQEIIQTFTPVVPSIAAIFDAWDHSAMKTFNLTSVGLSIGFANSVRMAKFEASLSIWIK